MLPLWYKGFPGIPSFLERVERIWLNVGVLMPQGTILDLPKSNVLADLFISNGEEYSLSVCS